jgi:hypothetical protein
MGLETGTYVDDLVATNPITTDTKSQGDDHLRLLKSILKATFPSASKAFYFPTGLAKTASYTILASDMNTLITADCTAGDVDLTLPTLAAADAGWSCVVARIDASANAVNLIGTINGDTDLVISTQYQHVVAVWSGTAWYANGLVRINAAGTLQLSATTAASLALTGLLDASAYTSHMKLPSGTTAQRPGSPAAGDVRYNSSTNAFEYYNGTAWAGQGLPRGYIDGCTLSNNATDATNDIDIAAGSCRDGTNSVDMTVAAMTGKQIDANWVAGSGAGMRNSAAGVTNGAYHVYSVTKADRTQDVYAYAGVAGTDPDSAASLAAVIAALQAESGGADYLYARRLGTILREGGVNVAFVQTGDYFTRKAAASDVSVSNPGTSAVLAPLSVPLGLKVKTTVWVGWVWSGGTGNALITSPDVTDVAPSTSNSNLCQNGSATGTSEQIEVYTDTSGQIRYRFSGSAASSSVYIHTVAWVDQRGRNA